MLDEVAPKLKTGVRMPSETVRADAREGDIDMQLGEISKANPEVAIGSYPFFDPQHGPNTMRCCLPVMHRSWRRPNGGKHRGRNRISLRSATTAPVAAITNPTLTAGRAREPGPRPKAELIDAG